MFGILNMMDRSLAIPYQGVIVIESCYQSYSETLLQLANYTITFTKSDTFRFNVLYNLGPIVTCVRSLVSFWLYPDYTRVKEWNDVGMEIGNIFYFMINPIEDTIRRTLDNGGGFE